ncbi:MAG TPA: PilZ domain-containing protein [Nitrospira sp.]|nr:PilZ domain-containing protein [Nitrospira sp.]
MTMERRKHPRYPVEYVLSLLGERSQGQGVTQDLSVTGCRARSPIGMTSGVSVGLLIDVPRYENPLLVDMAIIRWAKEQEFGMEFIDIAPDNQQRLQEVIRGSETNRMV